MGKETPSPGQKESLGRKAIDKKQEWNKFELAVEVLGAGAAAVLAPPLVIPIAAAGALNGAETLALHAEQMRHKKSAEKSAAQPQQSLQQESSPASPNKPPQTERLWQREIMSQLGATTEEVAIVPMEKSPFNPRTPRKTVFQAA
jgi:hypothetical protein